MRRTIRIDVLRELMESAEEEQISILEVFPSVNIRNDLPSLKMRFKPPKKVDIIGSFLLHTGSL